MAVKPRPAIPSDKSSSEESAVVWFISTLVSSKEEFIAQDLFDRTALKFSVTSSTRDLHFSRFPIFIPAT
jgi:hypothetical protein